MDLKVGQRRNFSFSDKVYRIREILENPGISMWWTWTTGICPHCKKNIERKIKHDFYRIEILGNDAKEDKDLAIKDIVLMGDTMDKRRMVIPIDDQAFSETLEKSKKFKKIAKKKEIT